MEIQQINVIKFKVGFMESRTSNSLAMYAAFVYKTIAKYFLRKEVKTSISTKTMIVRFYALST